MKKLLKKILIPVLCASLSMNSYCNEGLVALTYLLAFGAIAVAKSENDKQEIKNTPENEKQANILLCNASLLEAVETDIKLIKELRDAEKCTRINSLSVAKCNIPAYHPNKSKLRHLKSTLIFMGLKLHKTDDLDSMLKTAYRIKEMLEAK